MLNRASEHSSVRPLLWLLLALLVVVTAGAAALEMTRTLRSDSIGGDQGLFAEMALLQLNGGTLYNDLWDNKPPTVFFMLAPFIEILGNVPRAIKAETIFVGLAFTLVMGLLAYRLTGSRSAAAAAALITLLYAARVNRTETTLHMAMLGATAALVAVVGRGRVGWLLAAGLVFAAGVFAKQPLIFDMPALLLLAAWRSPTRRLRSVVAVMVGAAIGAGLVFGWSAANGSLTAFWERVFTSNFQYVVGADGRWHFTDVAEELADESQLDQTLLFLAPLVTLAAVSLALQWRAGQRGGLLRIVLLWLLLAFIAAGIGRGFKTNYFHQTLPPFVLLIAMGVPYALRLRPPAQAALGVVALVASLFFIRTALDPFALPSDNRVRESREVAAFMAAQTPEDGCVWMWGYLNYLNYLADRRSCTRVPYDAHTMKAYKYPVVANRSQFMHDLLNRQPTLHVLRSDYAYFPQLQRYADRYLGDVVLENSGYTVYSVDRTSWRPTRAAYNDEIAVIGVDVWADHDAVCTGDLLPVALTWEQTARPAADYTMVVQLVDADGALLASYEGALDGERPTTTWDAAGELFLGETFTLTVLLDAQPGDTTLVSSLRDAVTGAAVGEQVSLLSLTVAEDCASS